MLTIDASVWVSAFDTTDSLHAAGREFLRQAQAQMLPIVVPSFVLVETGCALARRFRSAERGRRAAERLVVFPLVRLEPTDAFLEREALILGAQLRLRGADALYAAVAMRTGSTLITTDRELRQRTQGHLVALTPEEWLSQQPG